jgi:predicted Fe-S protein YdhL (DUF1289 family)
MSTDDNIYAELRSPCISVCTLDPTRAFCVGCLRTVKEIGAWRTMTAEEKIACTRACEERARLNALKEGKTFRR